MLEPSRRTWRIAALVALTAVVLALLPLFASGYVISLFIVHALFFLFSNKLAVSPFSNMSPRAAAIEPLFLIFPVTSPNSLQ